MCRVVDKAAPVISVVDVARALFVGRKGRAVYHVEV